MTPFKPIENKSLCVKRHRKPDPRAALPENTVLDDYRFGKIIGRGSFSLVYAAVEVSTGRELVIKEFFPKHNAMRNTSDQIVPRSSSKELIFRKCLKQFYGEALALKNIQHPNVLNTHSFFKVNNTAYLVSQNQKGRDLKWFLNSFDNSLDQELILKVFLPVLSALNFLHEAKMLHLDIKPANILLQPNGQSLLLDFGASQAMDSSKRINKGQTLTHGFAPPEQYDKHRDLGPWTDLYAVAASLYYCISSKLPPKSKDSKVASQLDTKYYAGHYKPSLISAVNRCLSHKESDRFDNIDEFAAAMLVDSKWETLAEYEKDVMGYDRFAATTLHSLEVLTRYAA